MLRFCPYKAGVGGSSPSTPTRINPLVRRRNANDQGGNLLLDETLRSHSVIVRDRVK